MPTAGACIVSMTMAEAVTTGAAAMRPSMGIISMVTTIATLDRTPARTPVNTPARILADIPVSIPAHIPLDTLPDIQLPRHVAKSITSNL